MKIEIIEFGEYKGVKILLFKLTNDNGIVVKLMNYGATISSITIPEKNGQVASIVSGFDKFEDYFSEEYIANAPYFGCTVGRYCSQIKDASFSLEGKTYKLANNCGKNNLHGGNNGFDKIVWMTLPYESPDSVGINFSTLSNDMEEGFPGNITANVLIRLTNDNEIIFDYSATTDKTTPISLTNHSYFNLSGFKQNVETHRVQIFSNQLQEMDDTGAGTGQILNVSNSINDLQIGAIIGSIHKALGQGFEHFYIFENQDSKLQKMALITEPETNRKLEVFSTEPCMLFYTGKYTSDNLQRNKDEKYGKYSGICCETHRWQNGPNILDSPNTLTYPDKPFKSTTVFKLTF